MAAKPDRIVVEYVPIDSIEFDVKNARLHKKGIKELEESLKEFGQRKPLVVWHGIAIAGNGLLEAAAGLNFTEIAIARTPDDWTEEKARAFALVDNRTAELSEWNLAVVTDQLFNLPFDWDSLGFANFNLPKTVSFDVSPQLDKTGYAIIIDCENEDQQKTLLARFEKQKLNARALMT